MSTNVVSCHTLRVDSSLETNTVIPVGSDDLLVEQVKQFWELESIKTLPGRCMINFWKAFIKLIGDMR